MRTMKTPSEYIHLLRSEIDKFNYSTAIKLGSRFPEDSAKFLNINLLSTTSVNASSNLKSKSVEWVLSDGKIN